MQPFSSDKWFLVFHLHLAGEIQGGESEKFPATEDAPAGRE